MVTLPEFPESFTWGVSTSAYQIEGAPTADGRRPSVWDEFVRKPGTVADGTTGDVAADHYRRRDDDLDLIADLGVDSYRFSVSWPRIIPNADGAVNDRGLDWYDALVDGLLERDIEPMVTLFHWDTPLWLEHQGGWHARRAVSAFARYTEAVARRLGDRVKWWVTINEPLSVMGAGYVLGSHAPGWRNPFAALRVLHHLLLGHARAIPVIRTHARGDAQIGIANAFTPVYPSRIFDRRIARRAASALNRLCMDPIMLGHYPEELQPLLGLMLRGVRPGDMKELTTPFDFIGVNHYSRYVARRTLLPFWGVRFLRQIGEHVKYTALDLEVYPRGFGDILRWIRDAYGDHPMIVTENGAAFDDPAPSGATQSPGGEAGASPPHDGRRAGHGAAATEIVEDPDRVDYLTSYLAELHRAMDDGCDVRGYFVWSLLDNFEWAYGLEKRFGLYYVDYPTGRRYPKRSALWYRDLCRSGASHRR